jgi:hypothetical protein
MIAAHPNPGPALSGRADDSRLWRVAGWCLWLVPLLVITVMVARRPEKRTVTHLYHEAVTRWWQRQPLYDGPAGMNYLPQFAVLFSPWHLPPRAVGDVLWRWTAAAGLAVGLGLWCRALGRQKASRAFVCVTALALPLCLGALRNGQANAHFGAALLLAAYCLQTQRWGAAVALLSLATAVKPLGLAAMGLAWAAYPHLWWRLGLGAVGLAAFPFLFAPPGYALGQYSACLENLRQCSAVTEHRFADLNGLLRTFGWALAGKASLIVRGLAGAGLAWMCWRAGWLQAGPPRALIWLGATASFLMLFNPMTESNSYVIFAPALGLLAWWHLEQGAPRAGWLLVGMALTMGLLPTALRPLFRNAFALAWHPAMTLGFLGVLAFSTLRSSAGTTKVLPRTVVGSS